MARTSSIYDHFDLYLTPVTLTFNLPEKNVSNGTSPPRGQQLCKIIFYFLNPCINVQVMVQTSLIFEHFDLYLTHVTLTFNLPENVSNGTLPLEGNSCKIILKSMHKCTSYAPDKLNTCI